MSEKKCENCVRYVTCQGFFSPNEMFPGVDGGCGAFMAKNEGEWIKHLHSYECSLCNEEVCIDGFAEDYDAIEDFGLLFCPRCGAMMSNCE